MVYPYLSWDPFAGLVPFLSAAKVSLGTFSTANHEKNKAPALPKLANAERPVDW
jgi:hypothetical protein